MQRLDFGFEERLVQGLQGLALVLGIDDDADVALGGALADGPDADAIAAEGAKGAAGDAALLAHAVSDKGHDGKSGFDDERSDAAQLLVSTKLFVQCLFGAVGIGISHSDGNGVFRGALRHQDHIDSGQRQGCKQPAGKAGYPTMPPPLTVMRVMFLRVLNPATPRLESGASDRFAGGRIWVPLLSGSSVSRTCMGMSFSESCATVGGKTTFAPKWQSSMASA